MIKYIQRDNTTIKKISFFYIFIRDSEEEIGSTFGEDILKVYGNIDIEKAKEYQELVEQYYPIETIVYGIKNNKTEFIDKGRKEIYVRYHKNNNFNIEPLLCKP